MKLLFVIPAAILALLWTLPSPEELNDTTEPASAVAMSDNIDDLDWIKANCTHEHPCFNGQIPSFDNQDCWPTAIWCSPPDGPQDSASFDTRGID